MIKKKNKGFTLVELIVVIVILAILIAVTIGGIYMYVGKSRVNTDKNNASSIQNVASTIGADKDVYNYASKLSEPEEYTLTWGSRQADAKSYMDKTDSWKDGKKAPDCVINYLAGILTDGLPESKNGKAFNLTIALDKDNVAKVAVVNEGAITDSPTMTASNNGGGVTPTSTEDDSTPASTDENTEPETTIDGVIVIEGAELNVPWAMTINEDEPIHSGSVQDTTLGFEAKASSTKVVAAEPGEVVEVPPGEPILVDETDSEGYIKGSNVRIDEFEYDPVYYLKGGKAYQIIATYADTTEHYYVKDSNIIPLDVSTIDKYTFDKIPNWDKIPKYHPSIHDVILCDGTKYNVDSGFGTGTTVKYTEDEQGYVEWYKFNTQEGNKTIPLPIIDTYIDRMPIIEQPEGHDSLIQGIPQAGQNTH